MSKWDELRKAAEAATIQRSPYRGFRDDYVDAHKAAADHSARQKFSELANPATILALLAELEQAKAPTIGREASEGEIEHIARVQRRNAFGVGAVLRMFVERRLSKVPQPTAPPEARDGGTK